ncbi:LysR family transcriptional regulator [Microbulbifer sp. SSSA002]|uniref:LysR family transcriptional regulator n=1 Tax=Microbulbifer sp. SSSA002 TaxID=3243376 RepID=UPI00403A2959
MYLLLSYVTSLGSFTILAKCPEVLDHYTPHQSFKKAVQERFVTPSSVGHQIRVLETELQTKLFICLHRTIELTSIGRE